MANYAYRGKPPTTLTDDELSRVLRVSGQSAGEFRDHVLLSLAVGTGLREHEIAALDVMDIVPCANERSAAVGIRSRITLQIFKGHRRKGGARRKHEVVILPDECRRKLARYVDQLRSASGALELTAPLFRSRKGGARLATRSIRDLWRKWQVAAGLERVHPFHALRHTFVTNVYRVSKGDPVVTMVMARHKRIETTQIYIHASDNDMERIAKALPS